LNDDDPEVRAAGARQLRLRNLPGAIHHLLLLLDSPHAVERQAAQEGLTEFTFDRFAAQFDQMTPQARAKAGPLVRRVDSQTFDRLREELTAPNRSRRKRGIELAIALEAIVAIQDTVAELLKDEDQFLRIEAIRALATSDNERVRQLLRGAMLDPQPLVQQAAEAALAGLTQRETAAAAGDASRETVRLTAIVRQLGSLSSPTEVTS
jgi:HEAT repeat protein